VLADWNPAFSALVSDNASAHTPSHTVFWTYN
jgi:hypothetical protein